MPYSRGPTAPKKTPDRTLKWRQGLMLFLNTYTCPDYVPGQSTNNFSGEGVQNGWKSNMAAKWKFD